MQYSARSQRLSRQSLLGSDFYRIWVRVPMNKMSMIEKYWEHWALSPWHIWLRDEPVWLRLFLDVAFKLPQNVALQLLQPIRPLVFLPPFNRNHVIRLHGQFIAGANLLVLSSELTKRNQDEAKAIIAHELAHLSFIPTGNELQDDLKSDEIAMSWGFAEALLSALRKDLNGDHIRIKSLEQKINAKIISRNQ